MSVKRPLWCGGSSFLKFFLSDPCMTSMVVNHMVHEISGSGICLLITHLQIGSELVVRLADQFCIVQEVILGGSA